MKKILITVVVLAILVGGGYFAFQYFTGSNPLSQTAASFGALSQEYKNDQYRFKLMMPEGFKARESDEDGVHTILFENAKGEGIQLRISALSEDMRELTAERVKQDIPDMKVTNPQMLEVGNDFKGLAFKSDNEAFEGASREVWFPFLGNFYQFSTYERFDPLLKQMFATWQFF